MLALTMFCIGFAGKLFADEIEAINMGPVEALRAVGAGPLQVFHNAVLPQVRVAFVGLAIYTWDVAFRAATVVGFFGGGGMGLYLKRTVQQLENPQRGGHSADHHRARLPGGGLVRLATPAGTAHALRTWHAQGRRLIGSA